MSWFIICQAIFNNNNLVDDSLRTCRLSGVCSPCSWVLPDKKIGGCRSIGKLKLPVICRLKQVPATNLTKGLKKELIIYMR